MSATILTLERGPSRRLVVRMVEAYGSRDGREEAVELAVERRAGRDWARVFGFHIEPGELFTVSDALVRCCDKLLGRRTA